MRNILYLSIVLLAVACTASKTTSSLPFEAADLANAKAKYPSATTETLVQGKALFENRCSACHGLPKPAKFERNSWNIIYGKMVLEAKLTASEDELIQEYINGIILK